MNEAKKHTVVILDEDFVSANLIKYKLDKNNINTLWEKEGFAGLELIKNTKPDLVILDTLLPKISGLQVIKEIRCDEILKKIKIIVVSEKKREEDIIQSLKAGADLYITKPFYLSEVFLMVSKFLDKNIV